MDLTEARDSTPTDAVQIPSLSVIIPAFNEAGYIVTTLDRLRSAQRSFHASAGGAVQVIVVDNGSTDHTADLAQSAGAVVLHEPEHNIARARNFGAASALHDVLVFLDADTLVPPGLLLRISQAMADNMCIGGAVDCLHRPKSFLLKIYLKIWRVIGLIGGMAQGACQFCRKSSFQELGGYDEKWFLGEDVDFYWRLKQLAGKRRLRLTFVRDLKVIPSPRRWDRWPLWRTLIWTSPLVTFALRHRRSAWTGWYKEPPR